jgi:hypothetical protein
VRAEQCNCGIYCQDIGGDRCRYMSEDETLPPEMLPRSLGADVVIVCPSCSWRWVPEDGKCPNCRRGVDEPVN